MRVGRVIAVLACANAACAREGGAPDPAHRARAPVNRWVRWYGELRYVDVFVFPDGRIERVPTVETFHREEDPRPGAHFRVDIARAGSTLLPPTETGFASLDAEGYGWRDERRVRSRSDLVLPADPEASATWSSEYLVDGVAYQQTCRVDRASPWCRDGLVSTCRASNGPIEAVTRQHFCPGVGWRGTETALYRHGAPLVQVRSTEAEADGKPWADPPDEQRPYPVPDDVAHPDARGCGDFFTASLQSEACRACGERACCDRAPPADVGSEAAFACQLGCLLEPGEHGSDQPPRKVELFLATCLGSCASITGERGRAVAPFAECVFERCGPECVDPGAAGP